MDPQSNDLLIDFGGIDDKGVEATPANDIRYNKNSTCSSDNDFLDSLMGTNTTGHNTDISKSTSVDDFFGTNPFVTQTTSQHESGAGLTDLDPFDPFSPKSTHNPEQQVMTFDLLDGYDKLKADLSENDTVAHMDNLLLEGFGFEANEIGRNSQDVAFGPGIESVTLDTKKQDNGRQEQDLDILLTQPGHIHQVGGQPDPKDLSIDFTLLDHTSQITCIKEDTRGQRSNEEGQIDRISEIASKSAVEKPVTMSQRTRGNLNRSMEKSFEDLLTGLDSDGEPDIDDIINNCDLPEHVTDATFNALASENKKSYEQSVTQKPWKESEDVMEDHQLPRQSTTYTDEDDSFQGQPLRNGDNFDVSGVERVSFFSDEEAEEENEPEISREEQINDDPGVHSPLADKEEESFRFDERVSDPVDEKVEEEEEEKLDDKIDDDEDEPSEDVEEPASPDGVIRMSREDTNLTSTSMTFQGIDQEDSDPDIDKLVEDCAYLPETVTDSTMNFMVQSNKPLVKSYRESEGREREDEDTEDTLGENNVFGQDTEQNDQDEVILRDPSMDFSVIEQDSSHLDVDIGRQKTDLRKKGSLAKRRKPTRTNVRSALLSGEETTFQDSTGMDNKTADKQDRTSFSEEDDVGPTSPPAKKPSPTAIALPSLTSKAPPAQRKSLVSDEEDMSVDSTPKKNYRNIGVKLPVPERKSSRKESGDGDDNMEQDFTFEKPALKKVDRAPPAELKSPNSSKRFEVPALKSVTREDKSRKVNETESDDKVFNKPPLKQRTKTDSNVTRTNKESDAKFEVPSLKSVPKRQSEVSSESEKKFDKPSLRAVERTESGKADESDKTFVKPALKNAPKPYLEKPTTPKSPEAKTFEIPSLRKTPKVDRGNIETAEKLGLFDKPSLRNVSRPTFEEKDKPTVDQDGDTRYTFEKPTLRTVPRDNLPTQTLRAGKPNNVESKQSGETEEKHRFDLPTLRNVSRDSKQSESSQNTRAESESLSQLRTQLRATPRKDVPKHSEGEKGEAPSWLKEMKLKRTKSQSEDINDIALGEQQLSRKHRYSRHENQNKNNDGKLPAWGERERLRKTSNSLPLQESADNLISNNEETSRRKRSTSSELEKNGDILHDHERKAFGTKESGRDQYVPSWMKGRDSTKKSNPNLNFVSPPNGESSELPQWKRDLAERRKNRRDSDTPMKAVGQEKSEPSWKQEMKLKPATPAHSSSSTKKAEPEWKQKAEEKRQRIIRSGLFDKTLRKTE